jgi:hypothetical protein
MQQLATTEAELSQELANGKFSTVYDDAGNLKACVIIQSTGDSDLDHGFCDMARACVTGKPVETGIHAVPCMDAEQAKLFKRIIAERTIEKTH